MIVSQVELAECLGVSKRRVRQLQQENIIQRQADGYILEECVKAFIDYKVSSETGRKKSITKEELQADHERVKIQISKERLKRLRRESIDSTAAEASWMNMLTYFRSTLEMFPSKIVMETAGQDPNKAIETIDGMIKDLLKELAAWDPKDIEDTGDGFYDDEDEDDEEEETEE